VEDYSGVKGRREESNGVLMAKVRDAIARKNVTKNMSGEMKAALIRAQNPNWYVMPGYH
jgi:hypothetical protein